MSAPLHEQLADELGVDPDAARSALREYLEDVRAQAESGDVVEIPGLGTVSAVEGEAQLTPADALQEAVNYRNAHLEPLTVSESSPAAEPEPEVEDATVQDGPEVAAAPDEDEPADEPAADDDVVPDLKDDWTTDLEDEPPEEATPADEPAPSTDDDGATTSQVAGLVAAVALLFLALGYLVTSQGLLPGFGSASEQAASVSSPETTATQAASDTANADPANQAASQPPETPPTPESQSIDRARGGWTIVVASRTRPGEARSVLNMYRQRFSGEALPTDILTGETEGQLRYRITIGQYDSRQAAMTARQQLSGRIPDDAWPLEIQPDS
jgi:nucleoid DNA-binding protein